MIATLKLAIQECASGKILSFKNQFGRCFPKAFNILTFTARELALPPGPITLTNSLGIQ